MRFILRRIGFYIAALWIAVTLNFLIPRLMPGDPASTMFAQAQGKMSADQLKALKASLGYSSDNIFRQYLTYLWNMAHGNLGLSFSHFPVPVKTVIGQDLPWTLLLVGIAVLISSLLGTLLGIIAAWKRGSTFDNVLPPVLLFLLSFPGFWLGLALIYVLALQLGWFPLGHAYNLNLTPGWNLKFIGSLIGHAVLPAFVLVVTTLGGWALGMRNNMVSVLGEDYITLAETKGLSPRRVMLMYAARNAILPQVTYFALALAGVVSGQVFIETVFSYPGVGYDLVNAAQNEDYPLLQGLLLFVVFAVLLANFIADVIYVRLDPRAREG
ncbi:MAG TPA: peptide ABC transporter permease [Chloroflexi bacterium]|jgi:peptide/nickel transport system permease protein|nr:peptide ABC transporter permease [Chloroflexota bacterium]